jgi:hypothetical protein
MRYEKTKKLKVVDLDEINNFIVLSFFIWSC